MIEVKNGFVPEALLEQLYRLTPMEDSFGINNVALSSTASRTLGLKGDAGGLPPAPLRRRTPPLGLPPQQGKAARLHLVDGLLIALLDIDEVIQVIGRATTPLPRRSG